MGANINDTNILHAYGKDGKIKRVYMNDNQVWLDGVTVNATIYVNHYTKSWTVGSGCGSGYETEEFAEIYNITINTQHNYDKLYLDSVEYSGDSDDGCSGKITSKQQLISNYTLKYVNTRTEKGYTYGSSETDESLKVNNLTLKFNFSVVVDGVTYTQSITKVFAENLKTRTFTEVIDMGD